MRSRRRQILRAVGGLIAPVAAGCTAPSDGGRPSTTTDRTPAETSTDATTTTSSPIPTYEPGDETDAIGMPDGPNSPPPRPATLSPDSVQAYALTYEYRWVYNHLSEEGDDIEVECWSE